MPPGHGYTGGSMALDPLAGHPRPVSVLVDVPHAYGRPTMSIVQILTFANNEWPLAPQGPASSVKRSFNEGRV